MHVGISLKEFIEIIFSEIEHKNQQNICIRIFQLKLPCVMVVWYLLWKQVKNSRLLNICLETNAKDNLRGIYSLIWSCLISLWVIWV